MVTLVDPDVGTKQAFDLVERLDRSRGREVTLAGEPGPLKTGDAAGENLGPGVGEEGAGIRSLCAERGDVLGLAGIDLERRIGGIEFLGRGNEVVDGAVVRQRAKGGKIAQNRPGGQALVHPDLELGVGSGVPGGNLLLHLGQGRVDQKKRLGGEAALEIDQTAALLQHLAAGDLIERGAGKIGEGDVLGHVGPSRRGTGEKRESGKSKKETVHSS